MGIIALLDAECMFPKGADSTFANKLYKQMKEHTQFSVSNKERVDYLFTVKHYAGPVSYNTAGFLEKNKDSVHQEAKAIVMTSAHPIVAALFRPDPDAAKKAAAKGKAKGRGRKGSSLAQVSVANQFKSQLAELLAKIRTTAPHYVRCLKPNDANVPDRFNRPRIVDQLRYGGVLEAVRVARAGYPTRMPHSHFLGRYWMLAPKDDGTQLAARNAMQANAKGGGEAASAGTLATLKSTAETILDLMELPEGQHQLGITKVFMRKGAFEMLESRRAKSIALATVLMQTRGRTYIAQRAYENMRRATLTFQALGRGRAARREADGRRRERATRLWQTGARRWLAQTRYKKMKRATASMQAWTRGCKGRAKAVLVRQDRAALWIQTRMRMAAARARFIMMRNASIRAQCAIRSAMARGERKKRFREAKNVGGLQQQLADMKERMRAQQAELTAAKAAAAEAAASAAPADVAVSLEGGPPPAEMVEAARAKDEEIARLTNLMAEMAVKEAKAGDGNASEAAAAPAAGMGDVGAGGVVDAQAAAAAAEAAAAAAERIARVEAELAAAQEANKNLMQGGDAAMAAASSISDAERDTLARVEGELAAAAEGKAAAEKAAAAERGRLARVEAELAAAQEANKNLMQGGDAAMAAVASISDAERERVERIESELAAAHDANKALEDELVDAKKARPAAAGGGAASPASPTRGRGASAVVVDYSEEVAELRAELESLQGSMAQREAGHAEEVATLEGKLAAAAAAVGAGAGGATADEVAEMKANAGRIVELEETLKYVLGEEGGCGSGGGGRVEERGWGRLKVSGMR